MLTVGELKEMLKDVPNDIKVLKSGDDEGNDFLSVNDIVFNCFYKRWDWELCIYDEDELNEDEKKEFTKCIVLW